MDDLTICGSGPGSPATTAGLAAGPRALLSGVTVDEKRGELDQASIRGTLFLGLAIYHLPGTLNVQWRLQAESETVYEFVEICDYFALRFVPFFPGSLCCQKSKTLRAPWQLHNYCSDVNKRGRYDSTSNINATENELENKDT